MKRRSESGFTIIELLIATLVFSVVLLLISGAIVQIGRIYFKGITESRTQNVARTTINAVSQAIQFDPGQVMDTTQSAGLTNGGRTQAFCVGDQEFTFMLGQQRAGGVHSLTQQTISGDCQPAQDFNQTSGILGNELLGDKMRLADLRIIQQPNPKLYFIAIRVIYGDSDLLCSASAHVDCDNNAQVISSVGVGYPSDVRCKNIRTASQFCAVSELQTVVERRL